MQPRYSHENSVRLFVCLSVRLSVTRVYCDKREERSVQIFIPYERYFNLVYGEEEWLVGGSDHFYLKFWVNRPSLEQNREYGQSRSPISLLMELESSYETYVNNSNLGLPPVLHLRYGGLGISPIVVRYMHSLR